MDANFGIGTLAWGRKGVIRGAIIRALGARDGWVQGVWPLLTPALRLAK